MSETSTMPPAIRPRPVATSMNEPRPPTRTAARQPARSLSQCSGGERDHPSLCALKGRLPKFHDERFVNISGCETRLGWFAVSGGEVAVFLLEQPEPRVNVTV